MQEIVIVGAKGTAVNVAQQIDDAGKRFGAAVRVRGFAIDDPALGDSIAGFPVVCRTAELGGWLRDHGCKVIFALYRPDVMRARCALLDGYGLATDVFATFVHPLAYVAPTARLERGCVVMSHSSVMHNVHVGPHSVINANVTIEHDTTVVSNAFVAAGASVGASARIGRGVFVGLGASIREQLTVDDFAFVGMGAVVVRDVPAGTCVVGNPAKARA